MARREPVIGMTPATGGEVDDLLEPVWSWPERTMLSHRLAKGCPAAEPLPPPRSRNHGALNRTPTHPRN
jgi:hypothetical protein